MSRNVILTQTNLELIDNIIVSPLQQLLQLSTKFILLNNSPDLLPPLYKDCHAMSWNDIDSCPHPKEFSWNFYSAFIYPRSVCCLCGVPSLHNGILFWIFNKFDYAEKLPLFYITANLLPPRRVNALRMPFMLTVILACPQTSFTPRYRAKIHNEIRYGRY